MPPIATTGVSLVLGDISNAQGAALLFGTNVFAIIFGSAMSFYGAGIRPRGGQHWSTRGVSVVLLGLIVCSVPLASQLLGGVTERSYAVEVQQLERELQSFFAEKGIFVKNTRRNAQEENSFTALLVGPKPVTGDSLVHLESALKKRFSVVPNVRFEFRIESEIGKSGP